MKYYINSEGYSDPTAGAALSRITAIERSKRRKAIRKKNMKARRTLHKETNDK